MANSYDVVKDLEKLLDDKTIEIFGSPSNLKTTIEYVDKVRSFKYLVAERLRKEVY